MDKKKFVKDNNKPIRSSRQADAIQKNNSFKEEDHVPISD